MFCSLNLLKHTIMLNLIAVFISFIPDISISFMSDMPIPFIPSSSIFIGLLRPNLLYAHKAK